MPDDDWPFDDDDDAVPAAVAAPAPDPQRPFQVGTRVEYNGYTGTVAVPKRHITPQRGFHVIFDFGAGNLDFDGHRAREFQVLEPIPPHEVKCGKHYCRQCYATERDAKNRRQITRLLEDKLFIDEANLLLLMPEERAIYDAYSLPLRQQQIVNRAINDGVLTDADRTLLTYPQLQQAVAGYRDWHERNEARVLMEKQAREVADQRKERAKETLLSLLSKKEQKIYKETGHFHFKGPQSKSIYRLQAPDHCERGWAGTLIAMKPDYDPMTDNPNEYVATWCVHVDRADWDTRDCAAALMLAVQEDEGKILTKAYINHNDMAVDHPIQQVINNNRYMQEHYNLLQQGYVCVSEKREVIPQALVATLRVAQARLDYGRNWQRFTYHVRNDRNEKGAQTVAIYIHPEEGTAERIQNAYASKAEWLTPFLTKVFKKAGLITDDKKVAA